MLDKNHIIYTDDHLIIIDKPAGIPVHKNEFMPHDAPYVTKSLGEFTGKSIFNVHRLDAKTSGIMMFAFNTEMAEKLSSQFRTRNIKKTYQAFVYGVPDDEGIFDFPVKDKRKKKKLNALTYYKTIKSKEFDFPYHDKETTIISLMEIHPETGKYHQIRQHFGLKRHYILGDNQHGNRRLNKILKEKISLNRMMLHASEIEFIHPETNENMRFNTELPEEFVEIFI